MRTLWSAVLVLIAVGCSSSGSPDASLGSTTIERVLADSPETGSLDASGRACMAAWWADLSSGQLAEAGVTASGFDVEAFFDAAGSDDRELLDVIFGAQAECLPRLWERETTESLSAFPPSAVQCIADAALDDVDARLFFLLGFTNPSRVKVPPWYDRSFEALLEIIETCGADPSAIAA